MKQYEVSRCTHVKHPEEKIGSGGKKEALQ
jgi:hypothetical protein